MCLRCHRQLRLAHLIELRFLHRLVQATGDDVRCSSGVPSRLANTNPPSSGELLRAERAGADQRKLWRWSSCLPQGA